MKKRAKKLFRRLYQTHIYPAHTKFQIQVCNEVLQEGNDPAIIGNATRNYPMSDELSMNLPPKPKVPENIWAEFTPAIQNIVSKEYIRIKTIATSEEFSDDEVVLWTTSVLSVLKAMAPVLPSSSTVHRSWLKENFTGLMLATGILTIAFGVLGAWGLSASGATANATSGFLDIAKLFAGALVGAAGAAGAGAATKK